MRQTFLKKYGAYITAIIVSILVGCIYCAPSLSGKILNAGDVSNYDGMVQEVKQYHQDTGDYSFWTGSSFCGMPTYQIGGNHYKSNTLLKPLTVLLNDIGTTRTPVILIIYFLGFFIMLRCFDIDKWICIAGAIAITLSSYFILIIPAGHITKTTTIGLMAIVIGGCRLIYRKRYGLGFILTAIPTAISFTRHPQMAYYICLFIGTLIIAELYVHIREKKIKDFLVSTLVFIVSLGIGLGTNCANVFANKEYVKESIRGGHSDIQDDDVSGSTGLNLEYATQWSYGIDESLSFMIPGVMGGASSVNVGKDSKLFKSLTSNGIDRQTAAQFCEHIPLYWGDQPFTSGNVYMGAVVCMLFVLGLIIVKGPFKWAIAIATVLSVTLAWGHNFMPLTSAFFNHFPLYNKFRSVSSILIVAEITMPLLGFMAIRDIMEGKVNKGKTIKSIYIATGITGGICLILALFGKSIFSFTSQSDASLAAQLPGFIFDGIINERKALLVTDSLRSLMFIAATAFVVWLFSLNKIKSWHMALALGILVLADMWPVDRRYFNEDDFISPAMKRGQFEMQPYERQILTDKDPHFRVLNLTTSTFNDARTSYYLKSLGGYHAAKLRRYQDLIDEHISKMNMNVISMLNAKYIITTDENGNAVPMRNTRAMGNAWYVDTIRIASDAQVECEALNSTDLTTTAIVGTDFADFVGKQTLAHDDSAFVNLTKYTPRFIDYESSSTQDGIIVFSEIYYPYGWKAFIDGNPTGHFRANYALRAINVPAGHHTIHFEFAPESVVKGDTISVICVIIMYLATLAIIVMSVIRKKALRTQAETGRE